MNFASALVLLYHALWLVSNVRAILSTNQVVNQNKSPAFSCTWCQLQVPSSKSGSLPCLCLLLLARVLSWFLNIFLSEQREQSFPEWIQFIERNMRRYFIYSDLIGLPVPYPF